MREQQYCTPNATAPHSTGTQNTVSKPHQTGFAPMRPCHCTRMSSSQQLDDTGNNKTHSSRVCPPLQYVCAVQKLTARLAPVINLCHGIHKPFDTARLLAACRLNPLPSLQLTAGHCRYKTPPHSNANKMTRPSTSTSCMQKHLQTPSTSVPYGNLQHTSTQCQHTCHHTIRMPPSHPYQTCLQPLIHLATSDQLQHTNNPRGQTDPYNNLLNTARSHNKLKKQPSLPLQVMPNWVQHPRRLKLLHLALVNAHVACRTQNKHIKRIPHLSHPTSTTQQIKQPSCPKTDPAAHWGPVQQGLLQANMPSLLCTVCIASHYANSSNSRRQTIFVLQDIHNGHNHSTAVDDQVKEPHMHAHREQDRKA